MKHKYDMLVKILDSLRLEAPNSYKKYHPDEDDSEALIKARSLAFIHLLLKVRFGLIDFLERHQHITDGSYDGGLDAFYIDEDRKKLFLIQSKYRNNDNNFSKKSMNADDLIKMEVSRITKGYEDDSNGNRFNSKIDSFQEKIRNIRDIAKYDYIVFFLGNVYKLNDDQIRRLIDNCNYEIFDSYKAYDKLIFPLATGTYYNPDEIEITLELNQKESPRLKQIIDTDFGQYSVTAIFVPTSEIGRIMSKYKNAILHFNPRNFLSLQKKSVNENIRSSIISQEKNNFAILNNGITILSDRVDITESTGKKHEGQLILTKPQILNGGQTAYTLSTIYEKYKDKPDNPLKGKEVLLKIITAISETDLIDSEFVELISIATNQQNEVSEADRRSNHEIQVKIQKMIYQNYGYFYERKAGEFHDGIKDKVIDNDYVINRLDFIKAYKAYLGEPAAARRTSEKILFKEDSFFKILGNTDSYYEMFFSYLIFNELLKIEHEIGKDDSIEKYGYSLLYGKWAVVASIGITNPTIDPDNSIIFEQAKKLVHNRLEQWKGFDHFIVEKRANTKYFQGGKRNFELYYKINLLDDDVKEYFLR